MPVWNPPDRGFQAAHPILAGLMNSISLNPVQTTIGPGAIPLSDPQGYMKKVAGETIKDIGEHINLPTSTAPTAEVISRTTPTVQKIVTNASLHPSIADKVQLEVEEPGTYQKFLNLKHIPPPSEDYLNKIIQGLADSYHTSLLGK